MDNLRKCYGKYHGDELIPVEEFGKDRSAVDGIAKVCKSCNARYHRERRQDQELYNRQKQLSKAYYESNKQGYVDRKRKSLSTEEGYITKMVAQARCRARDNNLEFSITKEDIVIPSECPVLGIPMKIGVTRKEKDYSPSLDRIDPTKGYVKDNVVVVSWRANRLKGDSSIQELKLLYEYYTGIVNGSKKDSN